MMRSGLLSASCSYQCLTAYSKFLQPYHCLDKQSVQDGQVLLILLEGFRKSFAVDCLVKTTFVAQNVIAG